MITFRRLHLESSLSPDELRARLDAALGLSETHLLDPKWSGDIDTPFIGAIDGTSFEGIRRLGFRRARLRGSIQGNAVDAEIVIPERLVVALVLTTIVFFPIAILEFLGTRNDIRKMEAKLREIVSEAR